MNDGDHPLDVLLSNCVSSGQSLQSLLTTVNGDSAATGGGNGAQFKTMILNISIIANNLSTMEIFYR